MGKYLIICEKPSVAQDYARILGVSGRKDGYIENDTWVITWCVGHLIALSYPEKYDPGMKKWSLDTLPFLPTEYKYEPIASVKKQYGVVHKMLHRQDIDTVYWAGDSGREGQYIEALIRDKGGVRKGMTEKRIWIDSQTDEEIRRGIKNAKPMSAYDNMSAAGYMRAIEDYAMGINFSRALSVKYAYKLNQAAGTTKYTPISVGRVMTCVLGMVVNKEREIRDFKVTPFFRVVADIGNGIQAEWKAVAGSKYFQTPFLYKDNGFKERKTADDLISLLGGKPFTVDSVKKTVEKKKAPLLFNLNELQAECSKRFKISPDETLKIAQTLYEKKYTTYPRTDARVLSTAIAKVIEKNLTGLKSYLPTAAYANEILANSTYKGIEKTKYTDDAKITDHYAIIPTGQVNGVSALDPLTRQVYDLIVRRFLSIFYPEASYQKLVCDCVCGKEHFFFSAKVLYQEGYYPVAGIDTSSILSTVNLDPALKQLFSNLKKNDTFSVTALKVCEGKTSPPKRYDSGSIILAMENAGQFVEEESLREQLKGSGIGTTATRADILKKLVNNGYLKLNKKTQIITPEKLGEMIYEIVKCTIPALLNPKLTASWEKGLAQVEEGKVTKQEYQQKLEQFVSLKTETVKNGNMVRQIEQQMQMVIKYYK